MVGGASTSMCDRCWRATGRLVERTELSWRAPETRSPRLMFEEEVAALNSEFVSRSCQIADDRATVVLDGWLAVSRMYCIPPMLAPDTGTWICTGPAPAPWKAPAGRVKTWVAPPSLALATRIDPPSVAAV